MATITKKDLVDYLSDRLHFNCYQMKELVDDFYEVMKETLEKGESLKISGFGSFEVRQKNARPGRNPKTGEEVEISARKVVAFRPGIKLRRSLSGSGKC